MVFLLVDERRPPPPPPGRPDRVRVAWRVVPSSVTALSLWVVTATVGGTTGAFAAMGALIASFRVLDRVLPYKQGLREHRQ